MPLSAFVTPEDFFTALNRPVPAWAGRLDVHALERRFQAKVSPEPGPVMRPELGPCLEWTGYRAPPRYYGKFGIRNGLILGAHKVSLVLGGARLTPEAPHCLHRCDNPPCVRPDHLWAGTRSDNMKDAWDKGRLALRSPVGDDHPRAKVTEAMVEQVVRLRGAGLTQQAIADQVGLTQSHVSKVLRGVHRRLN